MMEYRFAGKTIHNTAERYTPDKSIPKINSIVHIPCDGNISDGIWAVEDNLIPYRVKSLSGSLGNSLVIVEVVQP